MSEALSLNRVLRVVSALVVFAIPSWPSRARAQDMEIPVTVQMPLFLKVTEFNRRVADGEPRDLVVVIAFQSGYRQSATVKDAVIRALAGTSVGGRMVRAVPVDLDRESLQAAIPEHFAAMLYVTPLRGIAIADIAAVARSSQVATFTGVANYVSQGVAVGVRRAGDRPKLMVNLHVARDQGADFSAEFLKLVQVVK